MNPEIDRNIWSLVEQFTGLLDQNNRIQNIDYEHEMTCRVFKIGEEFGEAVEARLGMLAQNPAKGQDKILEDLLIELADVVITASVAMYSLTRDVEACQRIISGKASSAVLKKRARITEVQGERKTDGD